MSSKAEKRRNKRRNKAATQDTPERSGAQTIALRAVSKRQSMKPTAERRAHGVWVEGKDAQPCIDLASDMFGAMYQARAITQQHLEAARAFQEARAAYEAELGLSGYRSCLAGGTGGHDDGDGNPEVFRQYKRITQGLTPAQVKCLEDAAGRTAQDALPNLTAVRSALEVICG